MKLCGLPKRPNLASRPIPQNHRSRWGPEGHKPNTEQAPSCRSVRSTQYAVRSTQYAVRSTQYAAVGLAPAGVEGGERGERGGRALQ
jgi:hypothetical protein